jgi:hypothetical protein
MFLKVSVYMVHLEDKVYDLLKTPSNYQISHKEISPFCESKDGKMTEQVISSIENFN